MIKEISKDEMAGYYSLSFLENSECELNNLCVFPEFCYKQIGEELLANALSRASENGFSKIKISIEEVPFLS